MKLILWKGELGARLIADVVVSDRKYILPQKSSTTEANEEVVDISMFKEVVPVCLPQLNMDNHTKCLLLSSHLITFARYLRDLLSF